MQNESTMQAAVPNQGKSLEIEVSGARYARLPIKTHVVVKGDDLAEILTRYAGEQLQPNDLVFMSERIVAISQGRAYAIGDIRPSPLARFLVQFVHKSPYGIGLGSPWTMELAIREAGAPRILLGAATAAITKPFGMKGVFYRVVGHNVNAIDGPCDYTLPPYDGYAKLGPAEPDRVARELSEKIGHPVVIIDANDLGVTILGRSSPDISEDFCKQVFRDNPLGQSTEQTPVCIVREISA